MQIIIPMSGSGMRFQRAGFDMPKPLIEVEGKPIIGHVVDLFPGETDFVFICNNEHLANDKWHMAEIIKFNCPTAKIVGIAPHKAGPVHAVLQAAGEIKPDVPTIVSYCDYGALWDYPAFKQFVEQNKCDGAVVGYTGFHPHMLRNHHYGYIRMGDGRVADIREKQPYSDTPMREVALCGAYYFRSAQTMLQAFRNLMQHNELRIEGEHYVSLAYRSMIANGADVRPFLLEHFMQWGTPEDLQDYLYWSKLFRAKAKPHERAKQAGLIAMPMAGEGKRFADAGYTELKPLIPVAGKPMAVQALNDLPQTPLVRVVLRRDLPQVDKLEKELPKQIDNLTIIMIDKLTEGQAITALSAIDQIPDDAMVTFAACDNGMIYDAKAFEALLADQKTDVIVWGAAGYPPSARRPQSYGWIDADASGKIKKVSVKVPLEDPDKDPFVIGTFTFRRAGDFRLAVKRMMERNATVNNEYYIDTSINDALESGLNCRLFKIDHYLGWGTPDELQTYLYWHNCFSRWKEHPYAKKQ